MLFNKIHAALLDAKFLPKAGSDNVPDIFNIVYALAGAIGVLVVIYASIQLIISMGNSEKVAKARRNVIYAIVGLVVIIAAGAITSYVIEELNPSTTPPPSGAPPGAT